MNNSYETAAPNPTAPQRSAGASLLRRVFLGDHGVRAGWSVLLFAAAFWILQTVINAVLGRFVSLDVNGPAPLSLGLLTEFGALLAVAAATLMLALIEKRPLLSYGYTGNPKLIRLATGAFFGFLCLSGLIGVLWEAKLLVIDGVSLSGLLAWKYAVGW